MIKKICQHVFFALFCVLTIAEKDFKALRALDIAVLSAMALAAASYIAAEVLHASKKH